MGVEKNYYCWDPFENFLFGKEEYDSAQDNDLLPLKCLSCGETFNRKKKIIQEIVENFNRNKTSISYCSKACGEKEIEYFCAHCGKPMKRILKLFRKTKTGKYFCSPKCKALYFETNKITRDKIHITEEQYQTVPQFLFQYSEYVEALNPSNVGKKMLKVACPHCGKEHFISSGDCNDIVLTKRDAPLYCSNKCFVADHNEEILEARRRTCLEKYGVDSITKVDSIKEKVKQNLIEKYGVTSIAQLDSVKNKREQTRRKNYFQTFIEKLTRKQLEYKGSYETYLGNNLIEITCKKCGDTFETRSRNPKRMFCIKCFKLKESNAENEIMEYIHSILPESTKIIKHDRTILDGKELDIYVPEKRIAFEYNGDFWHSDRMMSGKETNHLEKTLKCEEQGIRLIHIFEYEYLHNKEKILALIRSSLGVYDKVVYARKCTVSAISNKEAREFQDEYHLQGAINSSANFGLFYDGELIAEASWGRSRFKSNEQELLRYCVKSGIRIVGGLSKLISHSGISKFITFVDKSHFTGKGYVSCGFVPLSRTEPSFVYVNIGTHECVNRITAQKHKLKEFLGENFDPSLTEEENMNNSGWFRIFNSGNLKLSYETLK
jgi:hypothetical protein